MPYFTSGMTEHRVEKISKYLARHLRHRPERIGLTLDAHGWADIDDLLEAGARDGFRFSREELERVVATNDKRRYAFDDSGRYIRANQGHSIDVDLDIPAAVPPAVLYHGTVDRFVAAIRREGLRRMNRHAVHLSPDRETAQRVGARRGRPVVLVVDAARMTADGHEFHRSANGVWLVGAVVPRYLTIPTIPG